MNQDKFRVIDPSGREYDCPLANKEAVIRDLTLRGIINKCRIIDLSQEERLRAQAEAFKQRNQTAPTVVKHINTDANSSRSNAEPLKEVGTGHGTGSVKSDLVSRTTKPSKPTRQRVRGIKQGVPNTGGSKE